MFDQQGNILIASSFSLTFGLKVVQIEFKNNADIVHITFFLDLLLLFWVIFHIDNRFFCIRPI